MKEAITVGGLQFRDADGDGQLAPYEDWRLSSLERATDLASRMSTVEKVGTLMHSTMPGRDGELGRAESYDLDALGLLVGDKHVTSFITRLTQAHMMRRCRPCWPSFSTGLPCSRKSSR